MFEWFKFCDHCERPIDWRLNKERMRTSVLTNIYYCGDCVAAAFKDNERTSHSQKG